jgi:hypothetical protein
LKADKQSVFLSNMKSLSCLYFLRFFNMDKEQGLGDAEELGSLEASSTMEGLTSPEGMSGLGWSGGLGCADGLGSSEGWGSKGESIPPEGGGCDNGGLEQPGGLCL